MKTKTIKQSGTNLLQQDGTITFAASLVYSKLVAGLVHSSVNHTKCKLNICPTK
jgi:hypothetical protein